MSWERVSYEMNGRRARAEFIRARCRFGDLDRLEVADQWRVSGLHSSMTLEAWLVEMDRNREPVLPVLARACGNDFERWFARWRMFLMVCSELFRYRGGDEWFVAHTLMRPRDAAAEE